MEIVVNYINFHIILNAIICENLSINLQQIMRPLVITERTEANYLKANVMKLIPVAVLSKAYVCVHVFARIAISKPDGVV